MYIAWGSYQADEGSTFVATDLATSESPTGLPMEQTYTFTLRGTLTGTSQSDMKTKILALEAAFRVRRQDLILYMDDGNASAVLLKNNGSTTGTFVRRGPYYPTTEGAENALFRTWEVVVSATYPFGVLPDGTGTPSFPPGYAMTFTESLSISGGGALYVHKPNVLGPWQKQLVYPQTPFVAVQSGSATGYLDYPNVPPPVFPAALKETRPKVNLTGPQQKGLLLTGHGVAWEYQFESVTPLVGVPTFWRSL